MLIQGILLADGIRRVGLPACFLTLSMVPFSTAALGIGALGLFLPRRFCERLDDILYPSYLRICSFVFEILSDCSIYEYSDTEWQLQKKERAIIVSNHQSDVDWAVINMLISRHPNGEKSLRCMVKHVLYLVPLFGWYIRQRGYVFVRRDGFQKCSFSRQLEYFSALNSPFWLLMFPEGTRFVPEDLMKMNTSNSLCSRFGIVPFKDVLFPRVNGFIISVQTLRNSIDAIYDVTIGYGKESRSSDQECENSHRKKAPNMFQFVRDDRVSVHINYKRFPIDQVPENDDDLSQWLVQRFILKEKMMRQFRCGESSGIDYWGCKRELCMQPNNTILPAFIYCLLIIAPIYNKTFFRVYALTLLSSPIMIFFDRFFGLV